jgi:hypothetical protein
MEFFKDTEHLVKEDDGKIKYRRQLVSTYLDKAKQDLPIEYCYNQEFSTTQKDNISSTTQEKSKISLEQCSCIAEKKRKKKKEKNNICRKITNNKKKKYREYKFFDIKCDCCNQTQCLDCLDYYDYYNNHNYDNYSNYSIDSDDREYIRRRRCTRDMYSMYFDYFYDDRPSSNPDYIDDYNDDYYRDDHLYDPELSDFQLRRIGSWNYNDSDSDSDTFSEGFEDNSLQNVEWWSSPN